MPVVTECVNEFFHDLPNIMYIFFFFLKKKKAPLCSSHYPTPGRVNFKFIKLERLVADTKCFKGHPNICCDKHLIDEVSNFIPDHQDFRDFCLPSKTFINF